MYDISLFLGANLRRELDSDPAEVTGPPIDAAAARGLGLPSAAWRATGTTTAASQVLLVVVVRG